MEEREHEVSEGEEVETISEALDRLSYEVAAYKFKNLSTEFKESSGANHPRHARRQD